jgi:hypothetical protein
LVPFKITGSLFVFDLTFTPKIFRGFIILEKCGIERILSPLIITELVELDNKPKMKVGKVPEFAGVIIVLFLKG